MPESTCLHIQDRESGPIRVVELPWISVRIGRAAYCEVRLTEHDLADEACRLVSQGAVVASRARRERESPIMLEGRPVDGSCPLPFDVPFRVGPYCLTLRQDRAGRARLGRCTRARACSTHVGPSSPRRQPDAAGVEPVPAGPDRRPALLAGPDG